ncbi:MAG: RagB/SusD family nutrient uptake outer membrane protein [Gemmatimonadetes bacterium]|nr:RagB/SusD family nutrient uptake outer membrane protein [Gemmatimonadota bacterium]
MSHPDIPAATRRGRFPRARAVVVAATLAATVGGCLDLDVTDPNNLGINTVFTNAANTEAALIGSWKAYTEVMRGTCPTLPLAVYANMQTSTSATYLEYSQEPRIPINNRDNLNCLSRYIFNIYFEAAAGARESFLGIKQNNLKYGTVSAAFPDGDGTPSRKIFARFVIALSQLQHALLLDRSYLTDTITPGYNQIVDTLTPWPVVLDEAKKQLRAAIAEAQKVPNFTLPTLFINGRTVTRDELVRVMYSYLVRADVYSARTPAQRAAVPWAAVLARLDSGITRDFGHQADPAVAGTGSTFITNSFAQNTLRLSNRFVGPADTSQNYQNWLNGTVATRSSIQIFTPDRRISNTTLTIPATGVGKINRVTSTMGSAANGAYLTSQYRNVKYLNSAADSGSRTFVPAITVAEMNFIRAEALYRLGRLTEAAAILNATRVPAGLKPVDANGVPAGRDCVPRKEDGSCGDLFEALRYEKRIELFPTTADIHYFDERGWGRLLPGTPVHFPVVGRELITRRLEYYTFGGTEDKTNAAQAPNAHRP